MRVLTGQLRWVAGIVLCAAILASGSTAMAADSPESLLQRTRATYAALNSYADTGVVIKEFGASSSERYIFSTHFNRKPRHFVFDFHKDSGDRYVIWGDPDAFHTWWKTTGGVSDYQNPNNLPAINLSGYQTGGSVSKIPALLYNTDRLQGVFTNFVDVALDGVEEVTKRRCFRLVGRSSDVYGSGKEVNIHHVIVWIDVDSLFVRQVREEAKALPGHISRTTTTFEPLANPALDEKALSFSPPEEN